MIIFETVREAPGTSMGSIPKLALLCAVILAGCMPDSPRTSLNWDVNDTLHHRVASSGPAKTYPYQDRDTRSAPRPAPQASVTSQAWPPAGDAPAFVWPVPGRVISDFGATAN